MFFAVSADHVCAVGPEWCLLGRPTDSRMNKTMNGRAPSVLVLVTTLLAVPACDKGAAATAQEKSPSPSAPAHLSSAAAGTILSPSCALVATAEVSALLGIASLKEPEKRGEPPVVLCMFSNGRNPMAASLRYETVIGPGEFAVIRKGHDEHGQTTTDFPGLTTGAFSFSIGGANGVSFLHKNTVVMVTAGAPLDKVAALARVVMSRM